MAPLFHLSPEFIKCLPSLEAPSRERDQRRRVEAEANRFAAALLMPAARVRAGFKARSPDLAELLRLAREFDVGKEAMARTDFDAQREPVAVILLQRGRVRRCYRNPDIFPWIAIQPGQPVPRGSIGIDHRLAPGVLSDIEECEPDVWFGNRDVKRVDVLTEQLLAQRDGYAMILLHAELTDEDDEIFLNHVATAIVMGRWLSTPPARRQFRRDATGRADRCMV